jgi:hypothetical protein
MARTDTAQSGVSEAAIALKLEATHDCTWQRVVRLLSDARIGWTVELAEAAQG